MKPIRIIFFWIFSMGICAAQPDTIVIKQKIDSLKTLEARTKFLRDLQAPGQSYNGENVKFSEDMDILVSISYYLNTYGMPDKADYGDAYTILPLIFVHTSYETLSKLVFPLVNMPFRAKYISETQVRTNYLRPLYQRQFEDEGNKTKPLAQLFSELDLNTTDHIPLPLLIQTINDIIAFRNARKTEVLKFKAPYHEKEVNVNGNKVMIPMKSSPAEVFTVEDGRIFFQKISIDRSYEPEELILIGNKKYKFKDRKTYNYLEIDEEGSLLYRSPSEIIDVYKKAV